MKNRTITLTVGIPASGKSTWAKDFVKYKDAKTVRICRDDYRMMLKQAQMLDPKGEQLVTDLVNNAIAAAVNAKYDVIVDATNLNRKYLEPQIEFCRKYADVMFRVFDISLDKAIERDKNREASVGDKVIRRMWGQYRSLIDSGYDLYSTRPKLERIEKTTYDYDRGKKDCVIFDLDGTLAHNNGKRGYFDWSKVGVDDLDDVLLETLYAFQERGNKIVIVSGRDEKARVPTKRWLSENQISYDEMFLRPENDFRKDTVVKTEIYEKHIKNKYNVICVLEDRTKVVNMWRELGIKCFQVIDGDY